MSRFYQGQPDYIDKLNELAPAADVSTVASNITLLNQAAATTNANLVLTRADIPLIDTDISVTSPLVTPAATTNTAAGVTRDATIASAVSASTSRDTALTAWGKSTTGTYSGSTSSLHIGTGVKTIIYDTSTDSDGGAWRARCTDRSWYTETLGGDRWIGQRASVSAAWTAAGSAVGAVFQASATAGPLTIGLYYAATSATTATQVYRGINRDFPAVAAIVAENYRIVIYDLCTLSNPMWMVFENNSHLISGSRPHSSIAAINGTLCSTAMAGVDGRFNIINFINDTTSSRHWDANAVRYTDKILDRNNSAPKYTGTGWVLINDRSNGVAITALPNAPIDPSTGLPTPTIAVVTEGGISVIKDNGTVVNSSHTNATKHCAIRGTTLYMSARYGSTAQSRMQELVGIPASWTPTTITVNKTDNYFQVPTKQGLVNNWSLSISGLSVSIVNRQNTSLSMRTDITSQYNSGWQVGDTRLASLASTVAETITASSVITGDSSTFTSSVGNWIIPTGGQWRQGTLNFSGGQLNAINPVAVAVTSATWSANVVTVVTTVPHLYQTGEMCNIGGFTPSGYNGFNVLTVVNSTTVTYSLAVNPGVVTVLGILQSGAIAELAFPTVSGKRYSVKFTKVSAPGAFYTLGTAASQGSGGAITGQRSIGGAGEYYVDFTAQGATTYLNLYSGQTSGITTTWDTVTCEASELDCSVKDRGLVVYGSITKAPVATGASLVAYSGFLQNGSGDLINYLGYTGPANSGIFNSDFSVRFWWKPSSLDQDFYINTLYPGTWPFTNRPSQQGHLLYISGPGGSKSLSFARSIDGTLTNLCQIGNFPVPAELRLMEFVRRSNTLFVYINGALYASAGVTVDSTPDPNGMWFGFAGSTVSLLRISATAPTADQIAQVYRDELPLFQPNAQCTLAGTSNTVTALAYDDVTDMLHVSTSYGRSGFRGLLRVAAEPTSVGAITSLAARDGTVVTSGTSTSITQPVISLQDKITQSKLNNTSVFFEYDAIASQTAFVIPAGYTAQEVYAAEVLKREGVGKAYTKSFDGYQETVTFTTAPGAGIWVSIMCVKST